MTELNMVALTHDRQLEAAKCRQLGKTVKQHFANKHLMPSRYSGKCQRIDYVVLLLCHRRRYSRRHLREQDKNSEIQTQIWDPGGHSREKISKKGSKIVHFVYFGAENCIVIDKLKHLGDYAPLPQPLMQRRQCFQSGF